MPSPPKLKGRATGSYPEGAGTSSLLGRDKHDPEMRRWMCANVPMGRVTGAKTIEVIEVESTYGLGIEESPIRVVRHWYLPDGTLIGKWDTHEQQVPHYG